MPHASDTHHGGYDPNQPRVPKGNSDSGQWIEAGGGEGKATVLSDVAPDNDWIPGAQYANRGRRSGPVEPEAGQAGRLVAARAWAVKAVARVRELDPNWRPKPSFEASEANIEGRISRYEGEAREAEARLRELADYDSPPRVPDERPPTAQERNRVIVEVAHWMARHRRDYDLSPSHWLYEHRVLIESYCEPPKTMEQLQRGALMPKRGYDHHHIVEQTSARQYGFSRSEIDAPSNLVSIPRLKHWEITGWFATRNNAYEKLSPREYLRLKTWDDRMEVGRDALIRHGVLKP